MRWITHVSWMAAAVAMVLAGCAAPGPAESVSTLADRQADPSRRLAALHRLGAIDTWPDPVAGRTLLRDIVWSDSNSDALRIEAIDRLIADDADAFRAALEDRFLEIDRWPVIEYIFDVARQQRWDGGERDFTPLAVASYARPSHQYDDLDRPERRLIVDLNPGRGVEDVLLEMFIGLSGEADMSERVAAWTVLNRLAEPPAVRAMLTSSPPATPLVTDLQAAAEVVDILPADAEAVRWLTALRAREGGRWWRDAAAAASALTPLQRRGLELRHLPVITAMSREQLAESRETLSQRVRDRIGRGDHAVRTQFGSVPGPASEALADHEADLAWADLAVIDSVLSAMGQRQVVTQWFVQADADLLDTRTEYGGVLTMSPDGTAATHPFPPVLRMHDRKFYSSSALIHAMYSGLAHYHFHAQNHRNADYAGPGGGDLIFADRLRPNALVLTFIDRDTLNVDYYQPGGIAIDLGMVRR